MRLSEHFGLGRSQYELDFVDIDPDQDTPLFIDPYFLSSYEDRWSTAATRTIRSFFERFINLVRAGEDSEARTLFSYLAEPNETCLGLSQGRPSGRGIGTHNADDIFESLLISRAVATGLVEHLEDTRLFVRGIDKDKVSDMATNILRQHLIDYTAQQCALWGIPVQPGVPAGMVWSVKAERWEPHSAKMLVVSGRRLLLVPKAIVSFAEKYSPQKYHRHFVLNYLQHEHLRLGTALVQRVRREDGTERVFVTKKSVEESEAPLTKEYLAAFTQKYPTVFQGFRDSPRTRAKRVHNEELTNEPLDRIVDHLIRTLRSTAPGREQSTVHHRTVTAIIELVFYPDLFDPQIEREIDDGRKRIDITFDNGAEAGVFHRLHSKHDMPCPYILVECKNYTHDVQNPELDQLAGRFTPNRGKVGLMVCRTVDDMQTLLLRCRDHFQGSRGVILPLTDEDLTRILEGLKDGQLDAGEVVLRERLREIILS
jgi:hypothetical protein